MKTGRPPRRDEALYTAVLEAIQSAPRGIRSLDLASMLDITEHAAMRRCEVLSRRGAIVSLRDGMSCVWCLPERAEALQAEFDAGIVARRKASQRARDIRRGKARPPELRPPKIGKIPKVTLPKPVKRAKVYAWPDTARDWEAPKPVVSIWHLAQQFAEAA